MTDREEFEKWYYNTDIQDELSAWKAWQARGELDAVKIKELESDLDDRKREVNLRCGQIQERDIRIAELTAKLDKAREALNVIVDWTKDSYACHIAETAVKELDK